MPQLRVAMATPPEQIITKAAGLAPEFETIELLSSECSFITYVRLSFFLNRSLAAVFDTSGSVSWNPVTV